MRRALLALGLLGWLAGGPAACATPGAPRTAQDDCARSGGVWRAAACEQEAGGGGGGGGM
jgi:hypothetical protein